MKKLVLLVLLLLIGGVMVPLPAIATPQIHVEFPSIIPVTIEYLPVRISISRPDSFGYPRVPSTLKVSLAGFRDRGVIVPLLLQYGVDLNNPKSLYNYLNNPIEIEIKLPLPIKKIGFYRLIVDVQCLYGPSYRWNYWYSYTANQVLEIITEKIRIVSGPEIFYKATEIVGYFGRNYGTYKVKEGYIDVVDIISENGLVIDKVSVIRSESENEIKKVISSSNILWKPEKYELFLGNISYSFWRLRRFTSWGKFYGYSMSQAVLYDWHRKGISYTFKVQVVRNNKILYEEPAAVVGVAFSEENITSEYIEKEKRELQHKYRFLLNQFPDSELIVDFQKIGAGNWRWLFSTQPPQWVAEYGIVIEAPLPQSKEGGPLFPGLQGIEWSGMRWNPVAEFQLEVLPSN